MRVPRSARPAAQLARAQGLKVGTLRLITCWPFPAQVIRQMAETAKHIVVLENNVG